MVDIVTTGRKKSLKFIDTKEKKQTKNRRRVGRHGRTARDWRSQWTLVLTKVFKTNTFLIDLYICFLPVYKGVVILFTFDRVAFSFPITQQLRHLWCLQLRNFIRVLLKLLYSGLLGLIRLFKLRSV